jgi:hypothetical protein
MAAGSDRGARVKGPGGNKAEKAWIVGPEPQDIFSIPPSEREEPQSPAPPLIAIARLEMLVANPRLFRVAQSVLPEPAPGSPGRPARHPRYIYLVVLCCIAIFRSTRLACANLQHPAYWQIVKEAVRQHLGDAAAEALPDTGPTVDQWNEQVAYLRAAAEELRVASRNAGIEQARDQGLLASRRRGTLVRPHRSQVITGDGTVTKPPSSQTEAVAVDKRTGEIRHHRVDPDAGVQVEGGGTETFGNKVVAFATRWPGTPHSRVFLNCGTARHRSVDVDPEREAEAGAAVQLMHEIRDILPDADLTVAFDTAWRGVHRSQLIKRGVIVFTPHHDGLEPRPFERYVCARTTHKLFAVIGRTCERQRTVDGKDFYSQLPVVDLEYRYSGTSCRIYHVVQIPCGSQVHVMRIPVYETRADQKIDPRTRRMVFNRTEYLRIIPPETDAGRRLLGFRQDSESGNSNLDLSFRLERMPAYGSVGALLTFIGFAWVANSIALALGHHER